MAIKRCMIGRHTKTPPNYPRSIYIIGIVNIAGVGEALYRGLSTTKQGIVANFWSREKETTLQSVVGDYNTLKIKNGRIHMQIQKIQPISSTNANFSYIQKKLNKTGI